ncbi:hypothetical protein HNP86_001279 [Methanococcus maripaludis]|uniref:Uncharacterized protein n=1 Tax=Methanococcus maripaludis TaxID=39152 RepID=A0A7J9NTZ9_METMI|nr:nitrophenyl compound nitroreductase subunit ArsF family protein [Methanococcus maripaludis]MBA2851148.1 hypothetical protein [Methanococcus maripaludis]
MKFKVLIIGIVMFSVLFSGCVDNSGENSDLKIINNSNVEKIEVMHFHLNQQCPSCIVLGNYAEETINTYFSSEISSGKIEFKHLNLEVPENKEIVSKYGATGSSIWIGTYTTDGDFYAEENVNLWYKLNNKEDYEDYLKQLLEKRLSGDMG